MKHNNFKVLIETSQATGSSFICVDGDIIDNDLLYLIGQNLAGQKFRRTKYFAGHNFRHQAEISPLLSEDIFKSIVCKDFVGQKFRRTKNVSTKP